MPHSEDEPDDTYDVGYGKPPQASRFQKGQSGNPKGRPKKPKVETIDVGEVLDGPMQATMAGRSRPMQGFEIAVRRLVPSILKKDLRATIKFIRLCEAYNLLKATPSPHQGGVVFAPRGMTPQEWVNSQIEKDGSPSSRGEED